jgi:YD repeat-containing protein
MVVGSRVLGVGVVVLACVSGSAVQSQAPAVPACRIAMTESRTHQTGAGLIADTVTICHFDPAKLEETCLNKYSDNQRNTIESETKTKYASIDDVVDEILVVPPLRRSLRSDTVMRVPPTGNSSLVNTYDATRRLIREVGTTGTGPALTTTHTAWDAFGRPTASTVTSPPSGTHTQKFSYNGLTQVLSKTMAGGTTVCNTLFDADGNQTSSTCSGPTPGSNTVFKVTIDKTEKICR